MAEFALEYVKKSKKVYAIGGKSPYGFNDNVSIF